MIRALSLIKRILSVARRRFWRTLWNFLAVYGLAMILFSLFFRLDIVISNSMSPTLVGDGKPGSDRLLGENITFRFRDPKRWELVQFAQNDGTWVSKRVVGMPGEKIAIVNKKILINGGEIAMPAPLKGREYYAYGNLRSGETFDCGEGYFVLGDDSADSYDSRYEGVVTRDRIEYRSWVIVSPSGRRGFVNP